MDKHPTDGAIATLVQSWNERKPLTQREIARGLAHSMLESMRDHPNYATEATIDGRTQSVGDWLYELADILWPDTTQSLSAVTNTQQFLDAIDRIQDVDVQTRMLRTLVRFGHLHQMAGLLARDHLLTHHNGKSSVDKLLESHIPGAVKAVRACSKPRMDFTFTAHPTNTNSVAFMHAQRQLINRIEDITRNPDHDGCKGALKAAFKQFATTVPLPASDNRVVPLTPADETEHMLYFLGNAYDDIDRVHASYDRALGAKYGESYHPETLKLNIGFHSWGSGGDKDGNSSVTADATLYGIAAHAYTALSRYRDALIPLRNTGGLGSLSQRCERTLEIIGPMLGELKHAVNYPAKRSEEAFDAHVKVLSEALANLDAASLIESLEAAYPHAEPGQKPAVLSLLRKARIFGIGMGQIEFRETASEYTRIVSQLIGGYEVMSEADRCQKLENLLNTPDKLKSLTQTLQATFGDDIASKPYDAKDAQPIAYQTLKRLALTRDFPQFIQTHVLAECQSKSQMLECLLLQHAVTNENGKRAALHIVPLFEDQERLKAAPELIRQVLASPAYQQHLQVCAKQDGSLRQEVQLAHSDNARRSGMPAARGLVFEAHHQLRKMMQELNHERDPKIALHFYEGGSQSDPYRGGVRAVSAAINEFGLHDNAKMTFQGGDLLNYFNLPTSAFRLLVRNLSNSAGHLLKRMRPPKFDEEEVNILKALEACSATYQTWFDSGELTEFMDAVGFKELSAAGNVSSRAGARKAHGDAPVAVNAMRTIGFSETMEHVGLVPTWLGAKNLRQHLGNAGPSVAHALYKKSPMLRDVVDRMMFGLARSDLSYLDLVSNHHPMMQRLHEEYAEAFHFCIEAYTGKPTARFTAADTTAMRQVLIHEVFPHLEEVFGDQDRYLELAHRFFTNWTQKLPKDSDPRRMQATLAHNAIDTVHHGRLPLIDDPAYAKIHCSALGIERPHAELSAKRAR